MVRACSPPARERVAGFLENGKTTSGIGEVARVEAFPGPSQTLNFAPAGAIRSRPPDTLVPGLIRPG